MESLSAKGEVSGTRRALIMRGLRSGQKLSEFAGEQDPDVLETIEFRLPFPPASVSFDVLVCKIKDNNSTSESSYASKCNIFRDGFVASM